MSENKLKGALLVSASIIAAVRLAREPIKNSPQVVGAIADSIKLAQMILNRIERESNSAAGAGSASSRVEARHQPSDSR